MPIKGTFKALLTDAKWIKRTFNSLLSDTKSIKRYFDALSIVPMEIKRYFDANSQDIGRFKRNFLRAIYRIECILNESVKWELCEKLHNIPNKNNFFSHFFYECLTQMKNICILKSIKKIEEIPRFLRNLDGFGRLLLVQSKIS
ncbi:hypothetical protein MMG03_000151 [Fibrobacter succinogenes]|nr:hypothetical protein [Fibrobacter succinogenes]